MGGSGKAIIVVESKQDGEKGTHRYKGEWFRKERSLYIRYAENAETRALLRYSPGELSLRRSGGLQSEQLFVPGQRRSGLYRAGAAAFELETDTQSLALRCKHVKDAQDAPLPSAPPFALEWRYQLYVGGQMSGRFHIRLHIQEDHQS